jgi:hypothetical protein
MEKKSIPFARPMIIKAAFFNGGSCEYESS